MSVITEIVNLSLETACLPNYLKEAVLKPLFFLKNLDHKDFKNYRPVSNLSFLSKLIEKVVAIQLSNYLQDNHLHETLQSAYKKFHSTETALIKVHNDIATAIDDGQSVILVLLDLSAAFDTVDHGRDCQRVMEFVIGPWSGLFHICEIARSLLNWMVPRHSQYISLRVFPRDQYWVRYYIHFTRLL